MTQKEVSDLIKKISEMNDGEISSFVNQFSKEEIIDIICLIKRKRALSWKDQMLLQMIDKSPMSFWACDLAYIVRLWEGKSEEIYKRQMLGHEFHSFISRMERKQAMEDCITIIETPQNEVDVFLEDFKNYYTKDIKGNQAEIGLVTNSIQLYDEDTDEYLYAEIGLPIDLEEALNAYNKRVLEFNNTIDEFKNSCDELLKINKKRKTDTIKKIDTLKISNTIKNELRQKCNTVFLKFNTDIRRAKGVQAIDLDDYILKAENAIEFEYDELIVLIENSTMEQNHEKQEIVQINKKGLKIAIETEQKRINDKFDDLILKKQSIKVTEGNEAVKKEAIASIKKKKDEFSRKFSELLICVDDSGDVAIKLVEQSFHELQNKAIEYISNLIDKGDK